MNIRRKLARISIILISISVLAQIIILLLSNIHINYESLKLKNNLESQNEQNVKEEIAALAEALSVYLTEQENIIESSMYHAAMVLQQKDTLQEVNDTEIQNLLTKLRVDGLYLADTDGVFTVATAPDTIGFHLFDVWEGYRMLVTGEATELPSPIKIMAETGEIYKFTAVPRYDLNGHIKGILEVGLEVGNIEESMEWLMQSYPMVNSLHLFEENGLTLMSIERTPQGEQFLKGSSANLPEISASFSNPEPILKSCDDGNIVYYKIINRSDSAAYVMRLELEATYYLDYADLSTASIEEVNDDAVTSLLIVVGVSVIGMIIITISYLIFIRKTVLKPINTLQDFAACVAKGNLDVKMDVISADELGVLTAAFNKMTIDLKESLAAYSRVNAEKERIGAELHIAATIQASMLPGNFPAFPDRPEFDVYGYMVPAKEVGGDFYDFFLIDDTKLAVVIGDVSGKGVPAALFMVIAKTLIKNNTQYGKSPREVFETVNELLCENNEAGMFVTAFMGILDIPTGTFNYVNAGHNPPLIKRAGGDYQWLPVKPGFVLAGMEGIRYKEDEIQLGQGDMLCLYTDGVTEAANGKEELFSEPKLLEAANRHKGVDMNEFIAHIKAEIDFFADGAEQADDITLVILKIS